MTSSNDSTVLPTTNRSGSISYSSSPTDPFATSSLPTSSTSSTAKRGSLADINPSSVHPAANVSEPVNPSTESNPLNPHHRPSLEVEGERGVQGLPGDTTIRRISMSQNAPGKAGDVGEAVLGALGFGGVAVERPKEDQGLAEKIVEFLGA